MTARTELFETFARLHSRASPLLLFNVWDAGSARTLSENGVSAIATSSWAVAASHGYSDGETLPLELVVANAQRIARSVDLPVTIDIERGYGATPNEVATSLGELAKAGAVGCNLEDGVDGGAIRPLAEQAARIAAGRVALDALAPGFFINARTDLFLVNGPDRHAALLDEAALRADVYRDAGADGFFVPGLVDPKLLSDLAGRTALPVNAMTDVAGAITLRHAGVARISLGPAPYFAAARALKGQTLLGV